jgi:hypothetical protein
MAGVADGGGESRFRCGGVGRCRGEPLQCPVGSKLVVDALEAVELGLQVVQGGGGGLSCEQRFRVWWKRSMLLCSSSRRRSCDHGLGS